MASQHLPLCPVHQAQPDLVHCGPCLGRQRVLRFAAVVRDYHRQIPARQDAILREWRALPYNATVHAWLVATGWESDGSSASLDDVMGVRIGRSGTSWNLLPATLHDVLYVLSRRLGGLPPAFRKVADELYRNSIISLTSRCLVGWRRHAAWARAHVRYAGLRLGGRSSFQP